MRRILSFLAALGTIGLSAAIWLFTHSWWKGVLMALGCALGAFGKDIWNILRAKWAKQVADWIDNRVTSLFDTYHKDYAEHLYYRYRTFDIKGFSTQGKFALELETVYVELSVDPALISEVPQNPIRLPPAAREKGQADIFAWLQTKPGINGNFALVGPPR